MRLERPETPPPTLREVARDCGATYAINGLVGFIFAATGPVAVILSVGAQGGLSQGELASWIFGSFLLNGLLSMAFSWRYRMPLVFFWTIPGAVLVGPALGHLSFAQVIGAFHLAGLSMLLLGLSGWVRRAMSAVPMPIVMGMVAGVFLKFGVNVVFAIRDDVWIAAPMTAAFVVLSARPAGLRWLPPLIGTLLLGLTIIAVTGRFDPVDSGAQIWVRPLLQMPEWSWQATVELVLPLVITVLAAQNAQGFAVLSAAGHRAPVNAVTTACGAWSMLSAVVGSVSTCLTGPTNAIVASSGERHRHYTGAILVGLLALLFGALAPLVTRWMLATPPAFIATLAGLAMLRVLQTAFVTSFQGRFTLGALVAFLITVSDVTLLSVGAPFWALVFGWLTSRLLETGDFASLRAAAGQTAIGGQAVGQAGGGGDGGDSRASLRRATPSPAADLPRSARNAPRSPSTDPRRCGPR
jgi:benzoate membrane transport protein